MKREMQLPANSFTGLYSYKTETCSRFICTTNVVIIMLFNKEYDSFKCTAV